MIEGLGYILIWRKFFLWLFGDDFREVAWDFPTLVSGEVFGEVDVAGVYFDENEVFSCYFDSLSPVGGFDDFGEDGIILDGEDGKYDERGAGEGPEG